MSAEENQASPAPASQAATTRTCPYCKEQVLSEAVLCKHCGSQLEPERPEHGGTCPYCKEQIDPAAIKCKHCRSALSGSDVTQGCGCNCGGSGASQASAMMARLGSGGGVFGGSGGVISDPGHTCWQQCTDAYVACRRGGGGATCSQAFASCKRGCPSSGPEVFLF